MRMTKVIFEIEFDSQYCGRYVLKEALFGIRDKPVKKITEITIDKIPVDIKGTLTIINSKKAT